MKRFCLLFVLAASVPAVAADMYSWIDANGVKHFSDSPPPPNVQKAQKLKVKGSLTTSDTTPAKEDDSSNGPALAAAAGYSADDIKRNCTTARSNLATLTARAPVAGNDGSTPDPDAVKQHEAQVEKANQQIRLFCADH